GYGSQPGKALIVRGGSSPVVFDTSTYSGDRINYIVQSPSVPGTSCFGWSVAGLGDFNNDGIVDYAISDIYYNIPLTSSLSEGAVFIFFGTTPIANITTNESSLRIRSEWPLTTASDFFGFSVADSIQTTNTPGGDFNNDGIMDLLIGTQKFGNYHGSAFILFGSSEFSSSSDWLTYEDATFWFLPPTDHGMWGYSVLWLGDINQDGYSDIAIGDPFWDGLYGGSANAFMGRVSVIY
ncbi:integrin alpha, partial [Myxococcota bacterium]|nr:integrin alpha [Myxococcota bacterium]